MLYLKFGGIWRSENHIPCIFEYKIPRFRRYTRLKPWITTAFLISGRMRCFWYFVFTANIPVICIYQRIYHIAAMHDALYAPQFDRLSAKFHQINQKISGKTNSKNREAIYQQTAKTYPNLSLYPH